LRNNIEARGFPVERHSLLEDVLDVSCKNFGGILCDLNSLSNFVTVPFVQLIPNDTLTIDNDGAEVFVLPNYDLPGKIPKYFECRKESAPLQVRLRTACESKHHVLILQGAKLLFRRDNS
jgi:hypothetical protein